MPASQAPMTRTEAAYHLLVLLSVIDGNQDDKEIDSILNYLDKNYDRSFSVAEANQTLENLSNEDMADHFHRTAEAFANASTDLDRYEFLMYALSLVLADGELTADEKMAFASLADYWQVDLDRFTTSVRALLAKADPSA